MSLDKKTTYSSLPKPFRYEENAKDEAVDVYTNLSRVLKDKALKGVLEHVKFVGMAFQCTKTVLINKSSSYRPFQLTLFSWVVNDVLQLCKYMRKIPYKS